ncbi:MAG TPA: NAD-dependent epimerase/dehydratase family protein [Planctomycetota bacterium]|nr:NAD-dependent epimerase/dehydratase family protein [Planctomycetota bacterium]
MRVVVTGSAGFVGKHLVRRLVADGHDVHAGTLPDEQLPRDLREVPRHRLDVTDPGTIEAVLTEVRPDWIFHLAALAHPQTCREKPLVAWEVNFLGTHNLYRAAAEIVPDARVLFVGSAVEYGRPLPEDLPLTEGAPLRPADVYAATTVAGDLLGERYTLDGKLAVVRARPFNHIGPGQEPGYVASDFARQVARIERGLQEPKITVGNLDAARDFLDVRDVVRAYILLLEKGLAGSVYNVCSETPRKVRELLEGLLALAKLRPDVVVSPGRTRRGDADRVVGCAESLRAQTGWQPLIGWPQTLQDLLADWRSRFAVL